MLLKALNAGHSGQALMADLMESVDQTLTEMGEHNYPIGPTVTSERRLTWQEWADEWVWIEPGSFLMGSPESEPGREIDERQHEVAISRGFYLGKCVITQGQWAEVMGTAPWSSRAKLVSVPTHPAVFISWNDVQDFVSRLNAASEQWPLPSSIGGRVGVFLQGRNPFVLVVWGRPSRALAICLEPRQRRLLRRPVYPGSRHQAA